MACFLALERRLAAVSGHVQRHGKAGAGAIDAADAAKIVGPPCAGLPWLAPRFDGAPSTAATRAEKCGAGACISAACAREGVALLGRPARAHAAAAGVGRIGKRALDQLARTSICFFAISNARTFSV